MSYIPDCRQRLKKDVDLPYGKENVPEDAINEYWYGLLQGEDKHFISGFDYCVDNAMNNLFDNLDVYADELFECGIDVDLIDASVVDGTNDDHCIFLENLDEREPSKWYYEYSEEELEEMNKPTRLMLLVKHILNHYIEMERDELVTAMIDDMDEEKHKQAMERAHNNHSEE